LISFHSSVFPSQRLPSSITTTPQDPGNQDVWEKLSDALKTLPGIQTKPPMTEFTSSDTKKEQINGWDKIPEVLQQMIIKLSSTNDECFPSGPMATYLQILKQSKAKQSLRSGNGTKCYALYYGMSSGNIGFHGKHN